MPRNNKSTSSGRVCVWTEVIDDALINALMNQNNLENRVGGTFTPHVMDEVV